MKLERGCRWASFASFNHIEMRPGGREEVFEGISGDFPYLAVLSEHDRYHQRAVPWHWHQELELFYVLSGVVDYATPHERVTLGPGCAGIVNANVLHITRAVDGMPGVDLLIHMPRPQFTAERGSRVWRTCVEPLVSATSVELLAVTPDGADGARLCETIRRSFDTVVDEGPGWELRLRSQLSEIWLAFLELARPRLKDGPAAMPNPRDERLRAMIEYVELHFAERVSVSDIAAAAFTSERECHRTFRECLGVTPAQYLRDYRIQQACRMLAHTTRLLAAIAGRCGLGSPSHFGQTFRAAMGCTPSEYRRRWQDFDIQGQQTV